MHPVSHHPLLTWYNFFFIHIIHHFPFCSSEYTTPLYASESIYSLSLLLTQHLLACCSFNQVLWCQHSSSWVPMYSLSHLPLPKLHLPNPCTCLLLSPTNIASYSASRCSSITKKGWITSADFGCVCKNSSCHWYPTQCHCPMLCHCPGHRTTLLWLCKCHPSSNLCCLGDLLGKSRAEDLQPHIQWAASREQESREDKIVVGKRQKEGMEGDWAG